jgi:hypothetical protein
MTTIWVALALALFAAWPAAASPPAGKGHGQSPAQQCKAQSAADPVGFAAAWGSGPNAFGNCVSTTAKGDEIIVS